MDSRMFDYAVAVARAGNFRAAAERCHVTPPTLSVQIRQLEDWLQVRLFDRDRHPIRLTPDGDALFPYIERIHESLGALRGCARRMRQQREAPASPR